MAAAHLLYKNVKPIFKIPITQNTVYFLNLSSSNSELSKINTKSTHALHNYIFGKITKNQKNAAVGGYLEKRAIYQKSAVFKNESGFRNIHLGIDVWLPVNTEIFAPLNATIHSFQNNHSFGDYGPTLILAHKNEDGNAFHTLYGHLSEQSLNLNKEGKSIKAGDLIGWLGDETENVGWPPHLHFQVIKDMKGKTGDYPGVCSEEELDIFKQNCPDPSGFIFNDYES